MIEQRGQGNAGLLRRVRVPSLLLRYSIGVSLIIWIMTQTAVLWLFESVTSTQIERLYVFNQFKPQKKSLLHHIQITKGFSTVYPHYYGTNKAIIQGWL